ncbi:MAG: hypothetical protein ACJASL_000245 [Paraglaciecola sp.]|jgi:hypothetical protein
MPPSRDSSENKMLTQNKNIIPIAVLGDSDSHNYHDQYDNKARGGDYHSVTFNWPTLWDKFRSQEINMGIYGTWGTHYRIARIKHWLGLTGRAPKKLDYNYNYAVSGLRCESLLQGWPYQAKWLIKRLESEATHWNNGLVVIRISVNDLGSTEQLVTWGNTGLNKHAQEVVTNCVTQINEAIDQILSIHSSVKVAVMGMCRDCNITDTYTVWPKLSQIENRNQVLSLFDKKLINYASQHNRVLFIDDVKWLSKRYGDRHHEPINFETKLANKIKIISRQGNHPSNLILADYHAGTVYNGLWLNNLIDQLNTGFQLHLSPLTEEEIYSAIKPML